MKFSFFKKEKSVNQLFLLKKENSRLGSIRHSKDALPLEELINEATYPGDLTAKNLLKPFISAFRWRAALFLVLLIFIIFLGQAARLQIIQGEKYQALANANRFRTQRIIPPRGLIYDSKGKILAKNEPTFVLTMTIADIPVIAAERETILQKVADLAGLQRTELDLLITKYALTPFEEVPIKKGLPFESAMRLAVATNSLPGFHLTTATLRTYITSAPSLSHILGYTGKIDQDEFPGLAVDDYSLADEIGKTGIEAEAEKILRGQIGHLVTEVDARGEVLSIVSKDDPLPGANLILTIDSSLQAFIEARLKAVADKIGSQRGAVVAINPNNGDILAAISVPTYDNNLFSRGIAADEYARLINDKNLPLFPRAWAGEYPAGSTFKPFVAYAALHEGIIGEHTSFLSTGGLSVGPWFFPDWRAGGHGITDVRKALANSVNTFFYIIGGGYENINGLGVEKITSYARQFGFGDLTGLDLPGEADGFLPSKEWKLETKGERWYVGDTYNLAIGQGDLLVTPLQMTSSMAIIANGGHAVGPKIIQAVDGPTDAELLTDDNKNNIKFDQKAITIIRQGLRQTVTSGSAQFLGSLDQAVAGKTGTAQTPGDKNTHAWFTGFAPYNDPTIAIAVLVEEGGEGSSVAVPLARDIFEWWFRNRGE